MRAAAQETPPQEVDVREPLLLFGTCNDWGKDLEDTRRRFSFTSLVSGEKKQESHLRVVVPKKKLSFQIVSANRLYQWRIYPSSDAKESKSLKLERRCRARLAINLADHSAHGLNFSLKEEPNQTVEIHVLLDSSGAQIWYKRAGPTIQALDLGRLESVENWDSPEDLEPFRLMGSFCKWKTSAAGLLLTLERAASDVGDDWRRHKICFRMLTSEVKFQITSDRLGKLWRTFPKKRGKHSIILAGDAQGRQTPMVFGRECRSRGKCFKIRAAYLSRVTLTVAVRANSVMSTVEEVHIWYTAEPEKGENEGEDTSQMKPQVAIAAKSYQFPPEKVTRFHLMIQEFASRPDARQEWLAKLARLIQTYNKRINPPVLRLTPRSADSSPAPVRVAAMLMLRPSTLLGWPGVFQTYLWYHLLALHGPQFAHIFVFVDEPTAEEAEEEAEEEEGCPEDEHEEDFCDGGLATWLAEAEEAAQLRSRVTLLDGTGPASLSLGVGENPLREEAELRAAALGGELVARQVLNMDRCLLLAEEHGIDWLLCNLDADEGFCTAGPVGDLFASVPDPCWQLQFLNHEAVPEGASAEEPDFFRTCTLFKRNGHLLLNATQKQRDHMLFWGKKAADAVHEIAAATDGETSAPHLNPKEAYFTGYFNGKNAVRVARCRVEAARPLGPHSWALPQAANAVTHPEGLYTAQANAEDACILHYQNCQGAAGLGRKYSHRSGEAWNRIEFHRLCQKVAGQGDEALRDLLRRGLVIDEKDEEELSAQLEAGVCLRVTQIREACLQWPIRA